LMIAAMICGCYPDAIQRGLTHIEYFCRPRRLRREKTRRQIGLVRGGAPPFLGGVNPE